MSAAHRTLRLFCATTALLATTGCDNLFGLGPEPTALLQVLVTHHATPEDGQFPETRTVLGNREFDTDEGWTVTLVEAFVVTADVTLSSCAGQELALDRYWGALPENFHGQDLEVSTFGGAELSPGEYCGLTVTYGPFSGDDEAAREHDVPEDETMLDGATVYLAGYAERGDALVEFEIRSDERLVLELPITTDGGGPLGVSGDEPFPVELTLSKTYDRLFDGIDFSSTDDGELEHNVLAALQVETRLNAGTTLSAE
ncbi:MAG: hypothetical protein AAF721_15430 [Myxococcota bacterium]